jgi:hypothetical protein
MRRTARAAWNGTLPSKDGPVIAFKEPTPAWTHNNDGGRRLFMKSHPVRVRLPFVELSPIDFLSLSSVTSTYRLLGSR